ncbi:hypothetical protein FQA39_LY00275 [Lamprigera yunnana]|nr:hypothetical protein FQA39_LY00275 [Lamprigera yunnana]
MLLYFDGTDSFLLALVPVKETQLRQPIDLIQIQWDDLLQRITLVSRGDLSLAITQRLCSSADYVSRYGARVYTSGYATPKRCFQHQSRTNETENSRVYSKQLQRATSRIRCLTALAVKTDKTGLIGTECTCIHNSLRTVANRRGAQKLLLPKAPTATASFWWTLSVYTLWVVASDLPRILARRQSLANLLYTPYCKFDEDILHNDKKLENIIRKSDYVFSGKVIGDVQFYETNRTISFSVLVKRFFKNSETLESAHEVKVIKKLHYGEGIECRQIVRYRYIGIFIGSQSEKLLDTDVLLSVDPITMTLQNLERVDKAVKKGQMCILFI